MASTPEHEIPIDVRIERHLAAQAAHDEQFGQGAYNRKIATETGEPRVVPATEVVVPQTGEPRRWPNSECARLDVSFFRDPVFASLGIAACLQCVNRIECLVFELEYDTSPDIRGALTADKRSKLRKLIAEKRKNSPTI